MKVLAGTMAAENPPAGRLRGASSPPTTIHVIISPFCRQRMFLDAARASNSSQLVPSCPTNTPACSTLAPMSAAAARMLNSASRSIAPDQHHLQHPPPPPPTGAFLQTLKRSLLSRPFWSFFDVSCSSLASKAPRDQLRCVSLHRISGRPPPPLRAAVVSAFILLSPHS